jgi:hypothetical protein
MYNKITLKPEGFQVQRIGKQIWSFQYAHKKYTKLEQKKSLKQLEGLVMKEEDSNEIQEEVVVIEKGIDQERDRERDRQGHYYC